MLQKLRDQTQSTGFKILVVAIILVLTLFGFGATNLFLAGDPEIAEVGDFEITQNVLTVETERERRRLLAQMGPEFDPSNIDRLQLQEYVLQQLINRHVLYQTADRLGVRVAPETVNDTLVGSEAYQIEGRFNESLYRQQVQALGYTPVDFVNEFTLALSTEQLRDAIVNTAITPEWELGELVRVLNQRRDLAFLALTVDDFADQITVSDADVELRYNEEQSAYMTELAVDAEFVSLSVDDLLQDPSIEIDESELQSVYEEERSAALRDEQRASSHILIQVNDDRSDEQALELVTEIQARLNAGEAFENLAESLSEDPGSAEEGGSLGAVGKGIFDPAFETALWSLSSPGEISSPVRSEFGYHLIRLDEIVEQEYPSFEEQREALETKVRRSKALELFSEQALELERSAYEERYALDETAELLNLETENASKVDRATDHEILSQPEVLVALFSSDVLDGSNSRAINQSDERVVVVRVTEQYPPEPVPLEQVRDAIRESLLRERALAAIDEAKTRGMERLQAGDSVTEVAKDLGGRWQSFELAARRSAGPEEIPQAVRDLAFSLPRPSPGKKSVGIASLENGAALVTVTRVVPGNINTTTEAELEQIRQLANNRVARFDYQALYRGAEQAIGVSRSGAL